LEDHQHKVKADVKLMLSLLIL